MRAAIVGAGMLGAGAAFRPALAGAPVVRAGAAREGRASAAAIASGSVAVLPWPRMRPPASRAQ